MNKIAIIDIGSNSLRLVIVKLNSCKEYEILDEIKETVRLGDEADSHFNLSTVKIDLALGCLKIFKTLCNTLSVHHIIAVATEAVRRAPNRHIFINPGEQILNSKIRILSGEEEAFYDYLGLKNTISSDDGLILDIGGSSSEIILMKERQISKKISVPYGAIGLTKKFDLENEVSLIKKMELEIFLLDIFKKITWLNEAENLPLIGIGGSFRSLGNIHKIYTQSDNLEIHNYKIQTSDTMEIYEALTPLPLNKKRMIRGLSKERADIFIASLSEIAILVNYCNINEIIFSSKGLREGLIEEYMIQYCIN